MAVKGTVGVDVSPPPRSVGPCQEKGGRIVRGFPSRGEHRVGEVLRTILVASTVEVGLRLLPLTTVARLAGAPLLLEDGPPVAHVPGTLPEQAIRRLRTVAAVMRRWPLGGTCLRSALVAGALLRHWEPRLCIGVKRVEERVAAHAWLVVAGRPLDPEAEVFGVIHSLESA